MILVTGGAYSGKSYFIKERFQLTDRDFVNGKVLFYNKKEIPGVVCNFEEYIRLGVQEKVDFKEKLVELFSGADIDRLIIEIREVGSGIVPVDEFERTYRESVGRVCCMLAENADEVYRVVCGVGMRIK